MPEAAARDGQAGRLPFRTSSPGGDAVEEPALTDPRTIDTSVSRLASFGYALAHTYAGR